MAEYDYFPLSLSQQDIYFDQIRNLNTSTYNVGGYVKCFEVDLEKIKKAHKEIIANNDAFGLVFTEQNGNAVQYVTSSRNDELSIIDLSCEYSSTEKANLWVSQLFEKPMFSYDKTLYFSALLKVSDREYWYVCKCHHLIMDGVGFANWAFKLSDYYNGKLSQPETHKWSEVVKKDELYIGSKKYQKNKLYWQKLFNRGAPAKIFPKRTECQDSSSGRYNYTLSRDVFNRLNEIAQQLDVNVANLFIASIAIYLGYAYDQSTITFGVPAHNRKSHLEKGIINVFTNISPLSVEVDAESNFTSLVSSINKKQKENFRHQRFPAGHLSRLLKTQDGSYPFSGINFNFLNLDYDSLHFLDEPATVVYYPQQQDKLPLTVTFFDGGKDALEIQYDFHPAYFSFQDIEMLSFRVEHILTQLLCAKSLTRPIRELSILPDSEIEILLNKFVGESHNVEHSFTIHELFDKQTQKEPDVIALTYEEIQLSYTELNVKTDQLAAYLKQQGCGRGSLIGIYMNRSVEMVLAILAILKSGGAYVPLEPSLPPNRLKYIISDTDLAHILTTKSLCELLTSAISMPITVIEHQNWSRFHGLSRDITDGCSLADIAYVIYTSGSTGQPKGVAVSHRALLNRIDWMDRQYGMTAQDRVLQKTPFSFDVSVWEFLWPLSAGGQLVIAKPDGHKDPRYLSELIEARGITKLHFVPSMLSIMLKHGKVERCTSLKQVFCSGEELTSKQVQDFYSLFPNTELHNLYGPTEAAIDVSYWHCTHQIESSIPIGQAIQNTHLLVLNKKLELVPIGVIGELYISGVVLADGYLNKPDLTKSVFIDNPYYRENDLTKSEKLYKTGDLVRYRADGQLEYIGRYDSQVKIRGQRIELQEIENAILAHSAIDKVKVVVFGEKNDLLVAFIMFNESDKDSLKKIEAFISNLLPTYMIPNQFIPIEVWPLTANGKVDIEKIKSLKVNCEKNSIYLPENDVQRNLRSLWANLLKVEENEICVNDSFFRIGGNSLQCSEMIHEADERFQYVLTLTDIFQNPSISALAHCIENKGERKGDSYGLAKKESAYSSTLSFVQYQIWLAEQLSGPTTKHNLSGGVKLNGSISLERIQTALDALVGHHTMLVTRIGLNKDGEPFQFIDKPDTLPIVFHDLSALPTDEKSKKSNIIILDFCGEIFSLHESVLFKVCVIKLSNKDTLLYFSFHHIICDGWSVNIAFNKFLELYDKNEIHSVEKSPYNYFGYVDWQKAFIATAEAERQKAFWKEYLSGCNSVIALPFRKLRESRSNNNLVIEKLASTHLSDIKRLANLHESSLPNVVHCALAILLSRVTAERDLTLGIPVSGRNTSGTREIFGPFINNLPLRTIVDDSLSFFDFLSQQTDNLRQVLRHQELPFESILDLLPDIDRSSKETPLFQVCLNILSLPGLQLKNDSFLVEQQPIIANENKFNLTFYVSEQPDGLQIQCSYTPQYSADDIAHLTSQLRLVLEQVAKSSGDIRCSDLSLIDPSYASFYESAKRETIVEDVPTVIKSFEDAASKLPHALALSYEQRHWTYQELNYISSLYAQKLAHEGVDKGDIVAILSGRSDHLVIAMLATLKVGAAFLILPADEPLLRTTEKLSVLKFVHLLNLTDIQILAEQAASVKHLLSISFERLNEEKTEKQHSTAYLQGVECHGDDLAYIAFTSGTEGKPKAIKGRHSSLTAYTPWLINEFNISNIKRFAMLSGLAHDPLQREIFTAFMVNASVHIPNKDEFDLMNISRWLEYAKISVLNITPSLATMILNSDLPLPHLSHIFLCGEPLSINTAKQILDFKGNVHLVNMYGATETCRALSYYEVLPEELERYDSNGYISLGRGVGGVELLVLNEQNDICGVGEVGQLAIKAQHLALGYYDNDQLTAQKFVSSNAAPSQRKDIYLTGDYGRYDTQGNVHFFGRGDRQVKIRGYRVEPVEVETLIKRSNLVDNLVVNVAKNQEGVYQLIAYIVMAKHESKKEKELVALFRNFLPEYMVPSKIFFIESIPFTSNGKINWSELSELEATNNHLTIVEPSGKLEEAIRGIWQSLLNRPSICVLENFFDIGGNSILAVRALALINKEFSTQIPFSVFFEKNNIRELAKLLEYEKLDKAVLDSNSKKNNIKLI